MLELLNTKIFDNERNILNADLFVNNLKHTFKAFKFNTKITYEVYRNKKRNSLSFRSNY